jgi:hypothetical protein
MNLRFYILILVTFMNTINAITNKGIDIVRVARLMNET